MKRILFYIITILLTVNGFAQTIPYGISKDSVLASDGYNWEMCYYKPLGYDSINGPIIWGIHGLGSNGMSQINSLKDIADRRKALIVAPTSQSSLWEYGISGNLWLPIVFKELYRHVLSRENRDTIWVHMIGFSAGAQCVSRYMLIRQAITDSIPVKMAVSSNAYFYTFCTDSLNSELMYWPCGISPSPDLDFTCNEHVKKYYNENYAVIVGTADVTGAPSQWPCMVPQGSNRYERAVNFYNFSDSDAVARGTTLKWQYGEVPGVGHNQNLMYNNILTGDSMPLAERLLFESPYYPPVDFPPSADFFYELVDTISCTTISFNALCTCQNEPVDVHWNFGDLDTSVINNPVHTYLNPGTYQVELYIENSLGSANSIKNIYVENDLHITGALDINISPNPVCPGSTVYFSCYNYNADSYLWDFGDGTTSSAGLGVSHTFLSAGTYIISFTLSQNCHLDTTIYDTVHVENGLPLTGFGLDEYDPPVCYGGIVYFYGFSPNILNTYSWDFGDSTYSADRSTYHEYDSTGTYQVALTINTCGSDYILHDSVVVLDSIEPQLWWEYWASEDEACVNDTIELWGWDNGGSYLWDFGDGDTTSVVTEFHASWGWIYNIAKHAYSAPGNYTVSFIYTTNCGTFTDSFYVAVGSANASFLLNNDTPCIGENVEFTASGGTSLFWDLGDGTFDSISNPVHSYNTTGIYTATLIDKNAACSDTSSMTVNCINPVADFTQSCDTIDLSVSGSVQFTDSSSYADTWHWDFGDGGFDSIADPVHIYDSVGTYIVTLIINSGSCADTAASIVEVVDITGVSVKELKSGSLSVFPNPASETFNIVFSIPENAGAGVITIFDLLGRNIQSIPITQSENSLNINTAYLQNGPYFITLTVNGVIKAKNKIFIIK